LSPSLEAEPTGLFEGFMPTLHGASPDGKSHGPSGCELGRYVNQNLRYKTVTTEDSANRKNARNNRGEPKLSAQDSLALNCQVKLMPTVKASPSGPDFARIDREGAGGDDLATVVARETEDAGSLCPRWTSLFMGFPELWLENLD
jgi:hypothetical protein